MERTGKKGVLAAGLLSIGMALSFVGGSATAAPGPTPLPKSIEECSNNYLRVVAECTATYCTDPFDEKTCNTIALKACLEGAKAVLDRCLTKT